MDFSKLILQIREFIKDVWWRNRTEQASAELAVLQKKLELMKKYGVPQETMGVTLGTYDDQRLSGRPIEFEPASLSDEPCAPGRTATMGQSTLVHSKTSAVPVIDQCSRACIADASGSKANTTQAAPCDLRDLEHRSPR